MNKLLIVTSVRRSSYGPGIACGPVGVRQLLSGAELAGISLMALGVACFCARWDRIIAVFPVILCHCNLFGFDASTLQCFHPTVEFDTGVTDCDNSTLFHRQS